MNTTVILQSLVSGILMGGIYALAAAGLTLIFGVMKIINFAHGALMMLGMYITYWVFVILGIDPYLSILISMPSLFLIGALLQRFLINFIIDAPEYNQLLLTLGIALVLENLALIICSPDTRTLDVSYVVKVFSVGSVKISFTRLMACLFSLIMIGALYLFLKKTDMGKAIQAVSVERDGAELLGMNVKKLYYISFGLGAACVGGAGSMITPFYYISPHVGEAFLIKAFVVVILGGMGSIGGVLVGGLIIALGESLGALFMPGSLKLVVTFVIFIGVLLLRPAGIFGSNHG
ncbi:MAG: branched-chain amino acid ABC transporter permease [Proteobacteria bacterium]|nr:branched-chain amino acid ABC transporter permease [Pseudomonadota bacterium]